MINGRIVTQTVTFSPHSYPLRWAESPDEVPLWDVSRGVKVAAYWQEYPAPPTGESAFPNITAVDETLGWGGGAAPTGSESYPRLVAAKPHLSGGDVAVKVRASQAVAGLSRYVGKPLFADRVLEVASRYGLLNPKRGDSLVDWEQTAKRTAFDLCLIQAVNEARARRDEPFNLEELFDYADLLMAELESAYDKRSQRRHLDFLFRRSKELEDMPAKLREALKDSSFFRDALPQSADEVARVLFRYHWGFFQAGTQITLAGGRFNAVCGLSSWAHYELALAVQNASELAICPGCGVPFFKRGKQKVCDPKRSACRMAAMRKRT